jgi:hypothetical protein
VLRHPELDEAEPPRKILVVSPSSNAIDVLLDKMQPLSKEYKIVRIGQSSHR